MIFEEPRIEEYRLIEGDRWSFNIDVNRAIADGFVLLYDKPARQNRNNEWSIEMVKYALNRHEVIDGNALISRIRGGERVLDRGATEGTVPPEPEGMVMQVDNANFNIDDFDPDDGNDRGGLM